MNIKRATERYESWLGRRLRLVTADLDLKHREMRSAPFPFFRATFYRWAQTWEKISGGAARGPRVLAVGDLHVENFGTWRDIEGRLIWGINDFDEAWQLPYTNDLVRLATSALLAEMNCEPKAGVEAVRKGYADGVAAGGRPFALAEHHPVLREMAVERLHEPERYWEKLHALPDFEGDVPAGAVKAIARMLPEAKIEYRVVHRVAGLGSLGARAVRGACGMARRVDRARSQGAGPVCPGVGRRRQLRAHPLSGHSGFRRPGARSVRTAAEALDRAPPGSRLFADRAFGAAETARQPAPAARHGLRDRQYPSGQHPASARSRPI